MLRTTVLIVNYNAGSELAEGVGAVLNQVTPVRLLVIDNASSDDSIERLLARHGDDVELIRNTGNLGFARACNQGLARCDTDYLLILNADCRLPPGAIHAFEQAMAERPLAALASGLVFDAEGREQRGSRRCLPTPGRVAAEMLCLKGHGVDLRHLPVPEEICEVEALSGACLFLRRSALQAIGGFDEEYGFHFEDLDLMARLTDAGWRILLVPEVRLRHVGGLSSRSRPLWVSRQKHRGLVRYLTRHSRLPAPLLSGIGVLSWLHFALTAPWVGLRRRF